MVSCERARTLDLETHGQLRCTGATRGDEKERVRVAAASLSSHIPDARSVLSNVAVQLRYGMQAVSLGSQDKIHPEDQSEGTRG